MAEIIDISLPITSSMPVYPGTTQTKITPVKSGSGSSFLSEINMSSHAGTHIDAPSHALGSGEAIDSIPLERFYGKCRVLDMTACQNVITKEDLAPHNIQKDQRVLFKTTNSLRGFDNFYEDYVYLDGEAAQQLSSTAVGLVGIDALSVKKRGSPDNISHTALLSKGIPILEGLNLAQIESGEYTLWALPLAFQGIDGSPTRAVLLQL